MELESIRQLSSSLYGFYLELWMSFLRSKSTDWLNKNIPHIAFDEPVYNHIQATAACIDITEGLRVHELTGNWVIISLKNNQ